MATPRLSAANIKTLIDKSVTQILKPQDVGGGVEGTGVDCSAEDYVAVINDIATASATTVFTPKIRECATQGGSYTDVAAGNLDPGQPATVNTAADDLSVYTMVTISAAKPWIRVEWTDDSGGTPALIAGASVLKGTPLAKLKPYQLDQIKDGLKRQKWNFGSGEPPSNQPVLDSEFA